MNGYTNISSRINRQVEIFILIYVVEERSRVGEWPARPSGAGGEADTIIGKGHKQALVSLTERKFRLSLIYKVEGKTKEEVTDAVTTLLNPIKDHVLTLTSDNGKEQEQAEKIRRC